MESIPDTDQLAENLRLNRLWAWRKPTKEIKTWYWTPYT